MRKYINVVRENVSKYQLSGENNVELQEIIAVILGNSATPELAGKLASFGIVELVEMTTIELSCLGLSELKALELHAAFLIAKKLRQAGPAEKKTVIRTSSDAAACLMPELSKLKQEHFGALFLNGKNEVIAKKIIFVGGMNTTNAHPREIFREALKYSATNLIIFHNHPNGSVVPSKPDIDFSERMKSAGVLMDVGILDHIIIGDQQYISLKEKAYI